MILDLETHIAKKEKYFFISRIRNSVCNLVIGKIPYFFLQFIYNLFTLLHNDNLTLSHNYSHLCHNHLYNTHLLIIYIQYT